MNALPTPVHDLLMALWHNPACFFIVVALNLLGVMLQQVPLFPNHWNRFIPWLLFALGIVLTVQLVPTTVFGATQPHPKLLLGVVGFCFGVVAYIIHNWPVQWATNLLASKFPRIVNQNPPSPTATEDRQTK